MRILFAGTPAPAADVLMRLISGGTEVRAVLTRPDAPAGRGRRSNRCEVAQTADRAGIEVYQPTSLRGPQAQAWLTACKPDVVLVVAYGLMVPSHLLDVPRHGWLNLHFSLLPAWRGAAPVQRALEAGDEITGATVFRIEAGLDTGPVYGQVTQEISPRDNAGSLLARLCESGADLLVEVLQSLDSEGLTPLPQDHAAATWAGRVSTDEARIDWRAPALAVNRKVRAFTPHPGAWTMLGEHRVKLSGVPQLQSHSTLDPGHVRVDRGEVRVGTGSVDLLLDRVQPAGKPAMAATDWARGLRDPAPVFV